jgi:hypothetical protein
MEARHDPSVALRITGNNTVGEAAHRCTSGLCALADLAAIGDPGEFD